MEKILSPESLIYVPKKQGISLLKFHHNVFLEEASNRTSLCACSMLVPCRRAMIGMCRFMLLTTEIKP